MRSPDCHDQSDVPEDENNTKFRGYTLRTPTDHLARAITEVLAPAVLAALVPIVIDVHASGTWSAGLGWAFLTIVFSAVVPYGAIRIGIAQGMITDHHIHHREQRRIPALIGSASVGTGLAILVVLNAPDEVVAVMVAMLAVLVGAGAVNRVWKLSGHTSVVSGSVGILVWAFGPVMFLGLFALAATGWSRVRLRDHTTAQVTAGALLGFPLAFVPMALLG